MVEASGVALRWLTAPAQVDQGTREQLVACWRDVSNAGGAVGFPFPPVRDEQVRRALEAMLASLGPAADRVLLATVEETLAGWLLLSTNPNPLTRHWAQVLRVQTALEHRGRGIGRALMGEVVVDDDFVVTLLTQDRFAELLTGEAGDPVRPTAVPCLSVQLRDEVDDLVGKALRSGGRPWLPAREDGSTYTGSFADPDGHVWQVTWLEQLHVIN